MEQHQQAQTEPAAPADIYEAVSIIQSEFPVLEKSATNPYFGSTFTPLDDVAKKLYPRLRELGVAVMQPIQDAGEPDTVKVKTVLHHISSKTEIESVCVMPVEVPLSNAGKKTMNKQQAHGSTISYARRYSLTSILGIVCGHEDDDGGQPGPAGGDSGAKPSPSAQAGGDDQAELKQFKAWLKTFIAGKEQLQALCAWLALEQMPKLTWQAALTQVHVARAVRRELERIVEQRGSSLQVIAANAIDWHQKQQGGQAQ